MPPSAAACRRLPAAHAATPNSQSELGRNPQLSAKMDDAADSLAALFGSKLSLQTPIHATPHDRRKSAVALPESHPVSPAGSDGGASTVCADEFGGSGGGAHSGKAASSSSPSSIRGRPSPTSPPATSHFSIPAMRAGSLTPAMALPPPLPTATDERVTLNLFIDAGTPLASSGTAAKHAAAAAAAASEEACRLRAELDTLRAQAAAVEQRRQLEADQLRAELEALRAKAAAESRQRRIAAPAAGEAGEAAPGAQQAAAAGEEQRAAALAAAEPTAGVTLAIHIADATAQVEQPALAEPVQLVLNIVEPPLHTAGADGTSSGSAAPAAAGNAAALQQQLARAEACREELARQAGQLKGRIAKVGDMQECNNGAEPCSACWPGMCRLAGRAHACLPALFPSLCGCLCSLRARPWLGRAASRRRRRNLRASRQPTGSCRRCWRRRRWGPGLVAAWQSEGARL